MFNDNRCGKSDYLHDCTQQQHLSLLLQLASEGLGFDELNR